MNGTNIFKNLKNVFVIAEAGVNHNGDLLKAYRLVDEAKKAGADAVKFQTSIPSKSISKYAKMAKYQIDNSGEETSMIEMVKKISLPFDSFKKLKKYCDEIGIIFLSTPFHLEAVDFLNDLVPYFKVASGEIVNYPLLKSIAKKKKPIILSLKEMVKAIRNIEMALGDGIKKPNDSEIEIMKVARKSLIATRDIRAGEIIKKSDITIKRPGTGILPKFGDIVIGMKLINDIKQDETFRWENFK